MSTTRYPLVDLRAHHAPIRAELDAAIARVVDDGAFIKGPQVAEFERAFAAYCSVDHAIGVGNGTDALELTLGALDVEPGAEMITAANTFIATAEAMTRAGGRVRFADVDATTWTMDPDSVDEQANDRTAVLVPVHLFGHPVDYETIAKVAEQRELRVVEDAAQAHGARYQGRRIGSLGDAATFSFYPGKNLGAFGDAGAVVTNDPELADRVRVLADHGRHDKYEHLVEGRNSRLDTIQASVLAIKLARLDDANAKRRRLAARYREHLDGIDGVALPDQVAFAEPVHHLFVIDAEDRDELRQHLGAQGIGSGIHYPIPLHLQPAYRHLGHARGDFPVAERLAARILSLPLYPELPDDAVDEIATAVRGFYGAR